MTRRLLTMPLAAALVFVPMGAPASAACVQREDGEALLTFILPPIVGQMADICRTALPATTALTDPTGPRRLSLEADARAARPAALRAAAAMSDASASDLAGVEQELEAAMASSAAEALKSELSAKDCPQMALAFDALAPMSGLDLGRLLSAFLGREMYDICESDA